jgi:RNA polymerase sigma-70 factor (ECF subfamily)
MFVTALQAGDVRAMTELLAPDVVLIGDSNGKGRTTRQLIVGADKIARFFIGLTRKYPSGVLTSGEPVLVNGDLGVYLAPQPARDGLFALDEHVQAMTVRDGKIVAIYDVVNPDKLARITRPGASPS